MSSLLNFIYKYHYFILFLFLECFSITLVIQYNDYHRASFLNSSSSTSAGVYNKFHDVSQYLDLRAKNEELLVDISKYRNTDINLYKYNRVKIVDIYDSVYTQQYSFIPAAVINNSVNKQNNYMTLNIGQKLGVDKGMAVVSSWGVVGVVKDVSNNYATVISLLNHHLSISAMVKKNGYFGSLTWDGKSSKYATLFDLPSHLHIFKGDTIITSGYSSIFPKNEIIGWAEEVGKSKGGDFLEVKVRLAVDFSKLSDVLVVNKLFKAEQLNLEERTNND